MTRRLHGELFRLDEREMTVVDAGAADEPANDAARIGLQVLDLRRAKSA
jgi:hypothetical protein